MTAMLNKAGRAFARALIENGKVNRSEGWEFTTEDTVQLAELAGEDGTSKYHLGLEEERHVYPFVKATDDEMILHRAALVSISRRALEREEDEIHQAAESLLREIETLDQEGAADDASDGGGSDGDGGTSGPKPPTLVPIAHSNSLEIRKARERALLATLRGREFTTPVFRPSRETGHGERALPTAQLDVEGRSVTLSASSEIEVDRWFGFEILDHSPGAVRLERLRANGPLLSEHWGPQIGAIKDVSIDPGTRRLLARCKFGKSLRAEEEWQDVQDEIRTGVSIRYLIHAIRLEEVRDDDVEVYRVTDWEPTHIALVAEPADITVGVGRSRNDSRARKSKEGQAMTVKTDEGSPAPDAAAIRAQVKKEELDRSREIRGVATKFRGRLDGIDALEEKALNEGWALDRFNGAVVDMLGERSEENSRPKQPPKGATIGLSDGEAERWSWMRTIRALIAMETGQNRRDIDAAGFELEVSRAIAGQLGADPKGIYVPYERSLMRRNRAVKFGERVVNKATATAGGHLVATDLMSGNMIEALEARSQILALCEIWDGLVGNIDFPRDGVLPTAYHIGTEGNPITAESSPTVGLVQGRAKTLGVYTDITRTMQKQSSVSVDNWVEDRQDTALTLTIERMLLAGAGSAEPTGVLNTALVAAVAKPAGANAAERRADFWNKIVALKTALRNANGMKERLAYVTNPDVQGVLETTEKWAGTGREIWMDDAAGARMAGYQAISTTLCPNNLGGSTDESALIFGNWAEAYVLLWGVRDLTLDRASLSTSGGLRVVSFQDYDIQLANPQSFAVIDDIDVDNDF